MAEPEDLPVRRTLILISSLTLITAASAGATTFAPARIAPDWGLDALTRGVAREHVGRDLFKNPYATVTLGSVDIYAVFPYVETRTFQIVSDPAWNRLVYGEMGRSLKAYDGAGQPLGRLANPRGLAVDERNRVYVADAGNRRVVVLQATTEYGEMVLVPQFEIAGLGGPFDVSYSDGGTPFVAGDDWLYVADTGMNRVLAYALGAPGEAGATLRGSIGTLGSGAGCFAGPMAITAGRANGASTNDVYVADAHTRRLVRLRNDAGRLTWVAAADDGADLVTSLDTDTWGNLYAAAPNLGLVRKFDASMSPLAELRAGLTRPRSFRMPFFTVRDHRSGRVTREARAAAISVDQWSDVSGVRQWSLGVDVADLAIVEGQTPAARFTLTDPARVTLELVDAATGRSLARRDAGPLGAGAHTLTLSDADVAAVAGASDVVLRVNAASRYAGGAPASASTAFRVSGGIASLPDVAMLLGGSPNPVVAASRIAFVLPKGDGSAVTLRLYDSAGRLVRRFDEPFAPGRNEVVWDGTGDRGSRVAPGVYFVRLRAQGRQLTQRLVLAR